MMKVAVIENDEDYLSRLSEHTKNFDWNFDFFNDPTDFGKVNLNSYDVIVTGYNLPKISGRDLINSISHKTSAQIFLMGNINSEFSDEDINNEYINGLIKKEDIDAIITHLKYADVKLRINSFAKTEKDKYDEICEIKDGYKIEIRNDILVLGFSKVTTSTEEKKIIFNKIQEKNIFDAVVFIHNRNTITSMFLSELVYLYKFFKTNNGKMVFWNSLKSDIVRQQIEVCSLDKLFPTFDSLDDAIDYLNKK